MIEAGRTYREKILGLVEPVVESERMEVVDVECLRGPTSWMVRIYIDREGGVTLEDCAMISGEVGDILDIHETPPGPYDLEISSPGLDRPLKRERDFLRCKGKKAKVVVREPIDGLNQCIGLIEDVNQESVTLRTDHGIIEIPFTRMKKARLVIEF